MAGVALALFFALKIYTGLIIVWVFGSWFPQWRFQEWFRLVDRLVSPYVALFYPLKLNFQGFDFSPLVAMLSIQLFQYLVVMAFNRSQF